MWFERLTGFVETNADEVRRQLRLDGDQHPTSSLTLNHEAEGHHEHKRHDRER